jgi:predicted GNAT family acetyltransferase
MDGDKIIGECEYQVTEKGWNIYHTGVRPEYGGKGIAKRLVYKVLEEAERSCAGTMASCSYARKILDEESPNK